MKILVFSVSGISLSSRLLPTFIHLHPSLLSIDVGNNVMNICFYLLFFLILDATRRPTKGLSNSMQVSYSAGNRASSCVLFSNHSTARNVL
ncbi:hypothetical protein F4805DRAFT_113616 [Annulohypoxylon moriforme]|nr:hypothetical protein F4805DRAFT_113616 [Annulohypoxylon moriforme]